MSRIYLLSVIGVLVVGLLHTASGQVGACKGLDSCTCQYEDETLLSLAPLSRDDGSPAFTNVSDGNGGYVSWNPCKPFSIDGVSECQNVAVCAMRDGIPYTLYYDLGAEDSAQFMYNVNGSLQLHYTSDQGDFKRSAIITLQCLASSKFDFFVNEGEQEPNNDTVIFTMVLASKYACGLAPSINPSEKTSPLNGGEIFAIVFFSLVAAYLILGVGYQKFVKKESGKNLCPNHEFWCNITGACKGVKKDKGAAYDSI